MQRPSDRPRLIAITSIGLATEAEHLDAYVKLRAKLPPGTMWIQLRDRRDTAKVVAFGRSLIELDFQVIVNDRMDVARAIGARGVHLGRASVSVARARRFLGEDALVTRAVHRDDGVGEPADAMLLSPIFASPGKESPLGIDAITQLIFAAPEVAIFALGGVDGSNALACLDAGAAGVAVIRAALDPSAHESLAEALT